MDVRTLCSMFKIDMIAHPRSSMGDPEVVREILCFDTQAATGQSNEFAGHGGEHSILLLDGNPTSASGNSDAALPRRSPGPMGSSCDITRRQCSVAPGQSIAARPPMQELTWGYSASGFGLREGAIVRAAAAMSTMLDSLALSDQCQLAIFPGSTERLGSLEPLGQISHAYENRCGSFTLKFGTSSIPGTTRG